MKVQNDVFIFELFLPQIISDCPTESGFRSALIIKWVLYLHSFRMLLLFCVQASFNHSHLPNSFAFIIFQQQKLIALIFIHCLIDFTALIYNIICGFLFIFIRVIILYVLCVKISSAVYCRVEVSRLIYELGMFKLV